ncbi:MAG: tRNA pseudouridine(55) synthase TruB [Methylococcaceae bacterium]|nr:tRNA pseudouridine(55) synthase TruB [Methylococcaceae bacterium]MDZ4156429.1 tRNA pseudouridine(55) synthase TruB [Methylococcales bacterium]MDP2391645.1 tRNA pseudouridine(55) synthase TruB [Methylococcaceae bacterium]MDP3018144.1 tRNA pseudouridine(55) synthase TruB [Methylococcaceae bacterium]MDP3389357.1 tRNA pseudouridine(55) synthase TruB [Methylococcaceae bacterium]
MSKRKSGRNIHGILLLDKRLGVSSNKALQEVRRLFDANKAGHTGSLDPLATGLLPLCFGEATKVSALMLDDDKRYQVLIQLGVKTDTGDAEGIIISTQPVPELSEQQLLTCLQQFTGPIAQVPPMYSALKLNGKKLYELAREGITVERKARQIHIFELKLLEFGVDWLRLDVFCSKGTYIRSLAEDIGYALGCGGTVKELRRISSGQFDIKDAWRIEQLVEMDSLALNECLLDVDKPLEFMPAVYVTDYQADCIGYGQSIIIKEHSPGSVRIYHDTTFLGLGEILMDGKLAPKKLFNMNN